MNAAPMVSTLRRSVPNFHTTVVIRRFHSLRIGLRGQRVKWGCFNSNPFWIQCVTMTAGQTSIFAVESEITQAFERPSLRGLGFFVIHIMGRCYGIKYPDATMLANSFDEVG